MFVGNGKKTPLTRNPRALEFSLIIFRWTRRKVGFVCLWTMGAVVHFCVCVCVAFASNPSHSAQDKKGVFMTYFWDLLPYYYYCVGVCVEWSSLCIRGGLFYCMIWCKIIAKRNELKKRCDKFGDKGILFNHFCHNFCEIN